MPTIQQYIQQQLETISKLEQQINELQKDLLKAQHQLEAFQLAADAKTHFSFGTVALPAPAPEKPQRTRHVLKDAEGRRIQGILANKWKSSYKMEKLVLSAGIPAKAPRLRNLFNQWAELGLVEIRKVGHHHEYRLTSDGMQALEKAEQKLALEVESLMKQPSKV